MAADNLRKEGFVFTELFVEDLAFYARVFEALGFKVIRRESDFFELKSQRAIVLLNSFDDPDPGHPFEHFRQENRRGVGVEIGVVTERIDEAWQAAKLIEGCQVSNIVHQDWGMTDFRIMTPNGYYLRVTTPPEADPE
jgi:hypothetical protein